MEQVRGIKSELLGEQCYNFDREECSKQRFYAGACLASSKGSKKFFVAGAKWGERKIGEVTGRVVRERAAQEGPCQALWEPALVLSEVGSQGSSPISFTQLPGAGVWSITSSYEWKDEMLKVEVTCKIICSQ